MVHSKCSINGTDNDSKIGCGEGKKEKDNIRDFVKGQINYTVTLISCGKDQLRWMK